MIYRILRRALFLLDPEVAHELATAQMRRIEARPALLRLVEKWSHRSTEGPERQLWGLRFRNPLGIAAGFDKNALLVPFLEALGFGFVEVGTVTPLPQPGNPKPRMFRLPKDGALINRLGFNNDGAEVVGGRLETLWNNVERRGTSVEQRPPLFVNIGKNRDVPLREAAAAYRQAYRRLAGWAEGVVVNVSSPNTPGLRLLQGAEELREILSEIGEEKAKTTFASAGTHPVLVKLAPDLAEADLEASVEVAAMLADGMIATNTTLARENLRSRVSEIGGLSGRPLFDRSTETLRKIRAQVGSDYPLIGVGGIFRSEDARRKMEAGANLVQLYTGFIYEGPSVARRIVGGLR